MAFQPQAGQELVIEGVAYRIAEHPHAPGMPYGQEGRAATVYQVDTRGGERRALKVFKPRYQIPWLVGLADKLDEFASLPGLQVCSRTVLTATRHRELIRTFPDLNCAVLMPWIEGPTWMEVILGGEAWSAQQSLRFATSLVSVLARMEEHRLAHCDISGPNVLLPGFASGGVGDSPVHSASSEIELVDVEQLYGPGLDKPEYLPAGSEGYASKNVGPGVWSVRGDRFAGAVLVAEMLGWCDQRIRESAWGENYFEPGEMQQARSERYRLLLSTLRDRWGEEIARLFEHAWESETLPDCPNFGQWLAGLPDQVTASLHLSGHASQPDRSATISIPPSAKEKTWDTAPSAASASSPRTLEEYASKPIRSAMVAMPAVQPRPIVSDDVGGERSPKKAADVQNAAPLVAEARRLEAEGKSGQALAYYREAASLAPARSAAQREATRGMRRVEQVAPLRKASGSKAGLWWLMAVFALLVLGGAGAFMAYQGQAAAEAERQATAAAQAKSIANARATVTGVALANAHSTATTEAQISVLQIGTAQAQNAENTAVAQGHATDTAMVVNSQSTDVAARQATDTAVAVNAQNTATTQTKMTVIAQQNSANATATANAKAKSHPGKLVYGPVSSELVAGDFLTTQIDARDIILEIGFVNPAEFSSQGCGYDIQFTLYTSDSKNNDLYGVHLVNEKCPTCLDWLAGFKDVGLLPAGAGSEGVRTGVGDSNLVQLKIQRGTATVTLNNSYSSSLEVPGDSPIKDAAARHISLFSTCTVHYEDYAVWSLDP